MFVGKDSCGKAVLSVVKLENVAKIGMDLLKVFLMLISQVNWCKIRIWFSICKKTNFYCTTDKKLGKSFFFIRFG